jgi:hypothetical protein
VVDFLRDGDLIAVNLYVVSSAIGYQFLTPPSFEPDGSSDLGFDKTDEMAHNGCELI